MFPAKPFVMSVLKQLFQGILAVAGLLAASNADAAVYCFTKDSRYLSSHASEALLGKDEWADAFRVQLSQRKKGKYAIEDIQCESTLDVLVERDYANYQSKNSPEVVNFTPRDVKWLMAGYYIDHPDDKSKAKRMFVSKPLPVAGFVSRDEHFALGSAFGDHIATTYKDLKDFPSAMMIYRASKEGIDAEIKRIAAVYGKDGEVKQVSDKIWAPGKKTAKSEQQRVAREAKEKADREKNRGYLTIEPVR